MFPNGEVIGESSDEEDIYLVSNQPCQGVGSSGTLEEWLNNVLCLCSGNSRLIFSIGTAAAAFCLSILDEDGGGCNLHGRSSRGKTKCIKVGISFLANPDPMVGYLRTWRNTANAVEGLCALHNDSLLPMDELGQSEASEAGGMAYSITSGIEKGRLNRKSDLRTNKTWRTFVISSGEIGLESHVLEGKKTFKAGQAVRVIDIPAEVSTKHGCFENIHGYRDSKAFVDALDEACSQYYGTAGREFLAKLLKEGKEEARRFLRRSREGFISKHAQGKDGQVIRIASRFGLIQAALLYANKLGVFSEKLSEEEIKWAIGKTFNDTMESRGSDSDKESNQIIDQVEGLLKENSDSKFKPFHGKTSWPDDKQERPLQTIWGYKDGNTYYVLPKAYKSDLCKGFENSQVSKILLESRMIEKDSTGKYSSNKYIPSERKSSRFYVITLHEEEEDHND